MKEKFLKISLLAAIALFPQITNGQLQHPEDGFVFDDSEVPRIDITISSSNLTNLYADPYSDNEYKALFIFTRNDSTEGPIEIGLRLRGNTSREKDKKAFRVSFNTFESGGNFHKIEKMNLNAETNDPSLIRSMLSWHLFRYLGVPGSRSNHVLLYINDAFYGVYINTEHIDERFVKSRFGTNDGNLYKCLWPADLTYLSEDQDDYKFMYDDRQAYELEINEEWDDYEDLTRFISVLDQYADVQLREELEKVMNVQQYLKTMAVDVMTGNWDGYIANKNNFYLYRDQITGRFEYIPYDLDNTFGIDWLGLDWSDRSIYNWHREQRPLYEKLLQVEEYREQYTGYIKQLAGYMTSDELNLEMERWKAQISAWVSQDPFYPLDWGYEFSDFENALTTGWGGHVPYGVREYVAKRASSALAESIQADGFPLISHARIVPSQGRLDVDWAAEDNDPGFTATLHYRIDQAGWESRLYNTPSETDLISGIHSYRDSILSLADQTDVDLYFTVQDQAGQETRYPSTHLTFSFPFAHGPLLINEFMASNSNARSDENGDFDDWAEIYNPTDTPVWLGDLYLSDDMGVPGKYRFPDNYLNPDGFYLVWLDGEPEQGLHHAPFKISKDGEELRLSQRPANGFCIMDSMEFGPQVTDVSLGRSADGGLEWIAFAQSTPGFSNLSTGMDDKSGELLTLTLYPNPVTDGALHFSRTVSGTIYNAMGQGLMDLQDADRADVWILVPGIYIFRTLEGESIQFMVVVQ